MKKFKKILALSLALAMGLSLCACTGNGGATTAAPEGGDDTEIAPEGGDDTEAPEAEATTMEKPAAGGEKIYVYSWNTELGGIIENEFLAQYPEYKDDIVYMNLELGGTSDEYKTKLEQLIADNGAEVPSVFPCDDAVAKYFAESDYTVTMESVGITDAMYANAYQYTKDYGTVDGKLKALTWQATPGNVCYRRDIASKVLGTDDPAEVQEYLKDWDTFLETAQKMKDAGYFMLSGYDDVKIAFTNNKSNAWVTDDTLTLDDSITTYLDYAKKLYDADYTKKTAQWSDAWTANMSEDVFCYFGCTWFVYWSLTPEKTAGQWAACEGPAPYHWGGSYMCITDACPNKDLAAFLVYTICCDQDFMYNHFATASDYVNSPSVMKKALDDGLGASDMLGGQNPVEPWYNAADSIDVKYATQYDSTIDGFLGNAAQAYCTGTFATVDDAVQSIKDQVADAYSYITVE